MFMTHEQFPSTVFEFSALKKEVAKPMTPHAILVGVLVDHALVCARDECDEILAGHGTRAFEHFCAVERVVKQDLDSVAAYRSIEIDIAEFDHGIGDVLAVDSVQPAHEVNVAVHDDPLISVLLVFCRPTAFKRERCA
jgi:hypothetical protein